MTTLFLTIPESHILPVINDDVFRSLNRYMEFRSIKGSRSKYLFPSQKLSPISRKSLDLIMKRYCELAGISKTKAHFHVLRDTRVIELREKGFSQQKIQYWLGYVESRHGTIHTDKPKPMIEQYQPIDQTILAEKLWLLKNGKKRQLPKK